MIKLDASNTGGDFQIITKGEYEVFPTVFEVTESSSGNQMVTFNYVIRDDVDQEFKGREVRFDRFVVVDGALWRINQASKAADLDMEKEYESISDWAADFKNKAVRVYVDHKEFNGKTYPEIKNFKPSQVGGERVEKQDDAINIKEEDMPF